jgi:hypothetical protein
VKRLVTLAALALATCAATVVLTQATGHDYCLKRATQRIAAQSKVNPTPAQIQQRAEWLCRNVP